MDLRALRVFVAVADCGSVSRAADILHAGQPSLSRQLQRFEAEIGFRLFDRENRRMCLTASGMRLLPVARQVLTRIELADDTITALRAGATGSLTFCAPQSTATDIVAPFLATWRDDDPIPMVWETKPRDAYVPLEQGADLAVGAEIPPSHLEHLVLADLPVYAYVKPSHHWSSRRVVDLADIAKEQLLVLEAGEHARSALEHALAVQELPLARVVEFRTAKVAQAVAAAGRGIAVVSDDPNYDLVPLFIDADGRPVSIQLFAAWPAQHYAHETLLGLATRLRLFISERYRLADG